MSVRFAHRRGFAIRALAELFQNSRNKKSTYLSMRAFQKQARPNAPFGTGGAVTPD